MITLEQIKELKKEMEEEGTIPTVDELLVRLEVIDKANSIAKTIN